MLLPVVVLAGVGVGSLRQDRLLADQEARERAGQSGRQLAAVFAREAGWEMARFDWLGERWERELDPALHACRGTNEAGSPPPGWRQDQSIEERLAEWRQRYPGGVRADLPPAECILNTAGGLEYPREYAAAPVPPEWLSGLSAAQRRLLDEIQAGEATGAEEKKRRVVGANFLASKPPQEAAIGARLALLLVDMRTNTPAQAVTRLLRFSREECIDRDTNGFARPALASSGLPWSALAFGQALRRVGTNGLTEGFFEGLRAQISDTPSILTPRFIDEAEAMARNSPAAQKNVARLRQTWEGEERIRQLAHAIGPGTLGGGARTNFWIESEGRRFLVTQETRAQGLVRARFFPKEVVEKGFVVALAGSGIETPAWLSFEVEVAGERLVLAGRGGDGATTGKTGALLAVESGRLESSGGDGAGVRSAPGSELTVRLYLADPELLHARQHQRTVWFALLIATAAGTALAGCVAAGRALARQRRLSALKSDFVSSVSHELRAPIASVRLMAEGLERGKVTEAGKQKEYFHFMAQECRRLSSLVENVLDFSRIEEGRKQYEFEAADLGALARATVQLMAPCAAERGIELKMEDRGGTVAAEVDAKAIQQALINLVDNAVKYSPANSVVTVGVEPVAGGTNGAPGTAAIAGAKLWVEDHGRGIPAGEHERIFERFYRCGTELRRETQGVGIGLSIVRHIVRAHGGRVELRSAPGEGSRFTICLPAMTRAAGLVANENEE